MSVRFAPVGFPDADVARAGAMALHRDDAAMVAWIRDARPGDQRGGYVCFERESNGLPSRFCWKPERCRLSGRCEARQACSE